MKSLYTLKGASAIAAALFCIPIALAAAADKASPTVTATLPYVDNSAISAKLRADPLLSVDMNRGEIVSRLMALWQNEFAAPQRESFKDKLSALRADRLLAVSLVGTFDGVLEVLSGQEKSDQALATLMSFSAATGSGSRKALGDPTRDLVYTPITPCLIADSRIGAAGGLSNPLLGNTLYSFPGNRAAGGTYANWGGAATDCGLSAGGIAALALVVNFLKPTADAYIGMSDQNSLATVLSTSAGAFTNNQYSSVTAIVPQVAATTVFFAAPAGVSLNVTIAVVGYFKAPGGGNGLRVIQGGLGPTVINGAANNTATGGSAITVSGGESNAAAGDYGTIGGGRQNSTGTYEATVAGGRANAATGGASAIGGGYANTATGSNSAVAGGFGNSAEGAVSAIPGGQSGWARLYGQTSSAAGSFSAARGTAQATQYVLRNRTTDATPTPLFLDGVSALISFEPGRAGVMDIQVVAFREGTGFTAGYTFKCVYTVVTGGAGIQPVGCFKTVVTEADLSWDVNIGFAPASSNLGILVTGVAGQNIRWVATVRATEVSTQ